MSHIGPNINSGNPYQPPRQQGQSAASGQAQAGHVGGGTGYVADGQLIQQALLARQLGELLLAPLIAYQHQMSPQELQLFLRNLLQLPQDIQQLFYQLATGRQTGVTKQLLQLLQQNPNISLEELQVILKEAVSGGEGKLMKLLQSANVPQGGNSQMMGELMTTLGQLGVQVANSPADALAMTVLMYIPWYPLAEQRRLTFTFEQPQGSQGEGESEEPADAAADAHLIMLLTTVYLGSFRIVVAPLPQNRLWIQLRHDQQAAAGAIGDIKTRFIQKLKENDLPPPEFQAGLRGAQAANGASEAETAGKSLPPDEVVRNDSLNIHSVGKVPLLVIHGAYLLARIIFALDADQDSAEKK